MTEGLKWTVNHVAKSDDKHLELMSEENVKKANEFHKSFPQYTVTPLQDLAELASYLGVKSIHCKEGLVQQGIPVGKCLAPIGELTPEEKEKLHQVLVDMKLV